MKQTLQKFLIVSTFAITVSATIFFLIPALYTTVEKNTHEQAAAVFFSNNPQHIKQITFGPSPRSQDGRSVFDFTANASSTPKNTFWTTIDTSFDGIEIHNLLLDNRGLFTKNASTSRMIALTDDQILRIKWLQETKGMKVAVSAGIGLSRFCTIRNNPMLYAEKAAALETEQFKRLFSAGIRIDEYNIDGPFLWLIEGSAKEHSCAQKLDANGTPQPLGFSASSTAAIVAEYMNKLYANSRFLRTRHLAGAPDPLGTYTPKMNLVLNAPNERIGDYLEMHWGTKANMNGASVDTLFTELNKRQYPNIATVILDYPYNYVVAGYFTKADAGVSASQARQNLCAAGRPCSIITASQAFEGKVTRLATLAKTLKGAPNLSFYVNTSSENKGEFEVQDGVVTKNGGTGLPLCATASSTPGSTVSWRSQQSPAFLPFNNSNRCFKGIWPFADSTNDGIADARRFIATSTAANSAVDTKVEADADQALRDTEYFAQTRQYYNLITKGLPRGVVVDNLYLTSWHENPRFTTVYGSKLADMITAGR